MDNAVALVQAYLRVNGYFTVTEFPIVETGNAGVARTATDIDILAFRFPRAARLVPRYGHSSTRDMVFADTDPVLGSPDSEADMIVGEVKEGRAVLNRGAREPAVLRAALTRFGCCAPEDAEDLATMLVRKGTVHTNHGHRIRLVAFGSTPGAGTSKHYNVVLLSQVVTFLDGYLDRHWNTLRQSEFKEPGLAFMGVLRKSGLALHARGLK